MTTHGRRSTNPNRRSAVKSSFCISVCASIILMWKSGGRAPPDSLLTPCSGTSSSCALPILVLSALAVVESDEFLGHPFKLIQGDPRQHFMRTLVHLIKVVLEQDLHNPNQPLNVP